MVWVCRCGKAPATKLSLYWFSGTINRPVCYVCELRCKSCWEQSQHYRHRPEKWQYFDVSLSSNTKGQVVNQILAQTIGKLRSYLPKSDLTKAVRELTTQTRAELPDGIIVHRMSDGEDDEELPDGITLA